MDVSSPQRFVTYLFIGAAGFLFFLAIAHILYKKQSSSSMTSWLMAVFFIPYVAVPFYFLFGIRKHQRRTQKSYITFDASGTQRYMYQGRRPAMMEVLEKNGMPPALQANTIQLISSDTLAYETLMQEISDARIQIDICTYLFEDDVTTREILQALSQRAKQGVKVRLMLDIVGSFGVYLNQSPFKTFREAGGEVAFFVPFLSKPFQSYVNLRNHRKIYLFDRDIVLSGGMNLSDTYLGRSAGTKRWEDIIYRLKGPCAEHFYRIFINDWIFATDQTLPFETPQEENYSGDNIAQIVPSGPDIPRDALFEALLSAIYEAKERIWIVTPYFVPDDNIMQALIVAHHRGVDVKLITPAQSDHLIADLARSSYMRELDELGIDVVLHEGQMLHAKAILFDHSGVMMGSLNLDNRSLFLNYEVVAFAYSPLLIEEVQRWMARLMSRSRGKIQPPSKVREALENVMKVFAPLL